jgi:drug/metabolite transporter (DMT)-like permease
MAILYTLIAALAFGLSAPLAKLLLVSTSPLLLAGLLYLGAGAFLGLARLVWRRRVVVGRSLTVRDRWILAGVVLVGGVLAPPLLLWGLSRSPAASTALLLNLEVVFTALLAGAVFGEHLGARVGGAAVVMAFGGAALGWAPGAPTSVAGILAVAAACALWALDNNLMNLIAEGDALLIVAVKGLGAGTVDTVLAVLGGDPLPGPSTIGLAMALGAVSYGTSLGLFIVAMRDLGAARTGAYFATAPFFGAAGGILLLGEALTSGLVVAAGLMALATWLLVGERHAHTHRHAAVVHAHVHVTDAHHQHAHSGGEGADPHDHAHSTDARAHQHPHMPDVHHDHDHH